jgi:flagellar basal body-associated protein FliL
MAEKADKKAEATADAKGAAPAGDGHGEKKKAGGGIGALLGKTPVMLGGVMILEAVVLFAGFKFIGGGAPKSATGAEITAEEESHASEEADHGEAAAQGHGEAKSEAGHGESGEKKPARRGKTVELKVLDFRAPNKQSGRTFLYDVSIFAVTKADYEEKVKNTIEDRTALITDRVRTIIAQSDPEKLGGGSEPGLATLRRQVKYQLDEIVGEGMISEVLVPRCIPFRTDY